MTLQEFKAWFEGYTESLDSTPNEKQWKRIRDRVKEIDGALTTHTVFVDRYRYVPSIPQYTFPWPYYGGAVVCGNNYMPVATSAQNPESVSNCFATFDASRAFASLGMNDYQADAAA